MKVKIRKWTMHSISMIVLFFHASVAAQFSDQELEKLIKEYIRILEEIKSGPQIETPCQFSVQNAGTEDNCLARREYLENRLAQKRTISTLMEELLSASTDLIIIGENHLHSSKNKAYRSILEILKSRYEDFDCLFVELGEKYQSALDTYMLGTATYKEILASLEKDENLDEAKFSLTASQELLDEVKNHKLKIKAVDLESGEQGYLSDPILFDTQSDLGMNLRNIHMSTTIVRKIKTEKECRKGILMVGKAHVLSETQTLKPIGDLVKSKGLQTVTINLQDPSPIDPVWHHFSCSWNPSHPSEALGFFNSSPAPLFWEEYLHLSGRWDSFDATIIFP